MSNRKKSAEAALSSSLPRPVIGADSVAVGPGELAKTPEEQADSPSLPPARRAAWDAVHAFKANYFERHGRMPRLGHVMRRFRKSLAAAQARIGGW